MIMNRARTGQVWEGADGWIVLIVKADESGDDWLVHEITTLTSPDSTPLHECPTTVSENVPRGGMAKVGWRLL